jgi:ribosomal-protein-alanine N-acetyltransferase
MTASATALPLRIRRCGMKAAGALARLHATLFDAPWDAATFKELLAFPGSLAFAAGPGAASPERMAPWGLILGRVVVDEAEILTLGVAQDRRRLGIAHGLVERLCRTAGRRGAQRLHLEVAESNSAARALYARMGFREIGRRRGYYERAGAPPDDAINLCLPLARCAPGDGRHPCGRRRERHL